MSALNIPHHQRLLIEVTATSLTMPLWGAGSLVHAQRTAKSDTYWYHEDKLWYDSEGRPRYGL
jgi:hypothetical protein